VAVLDGLAVLRQFQPVVSLLHLCLEVLPGIRVYGKANTLKLGVATARLFSK
jgi:hypothetical protein